MGICLLSSRFFVEHNDKVSAEIFADIWLYQLWQWLGDVVDHRVLDRVL